jgi:hypothetical protein
LLAGAVLAMPIDQELDTKVAGESAGTDEAEAAADGPSDAKRADDASDVTHRAGGTEDENDNADDADDECDDTEVVDDESNGAADKGNGNAGGAVQRREAMAKNPSERAKIE